jgi:heptosyltransferase II
MFFLLVRMICKAYTNTNNSILIVSLQRIGDTVFTIPAIREIQKNFSEKIIIACFPESVPIYNLVFNNIDLCILEHDAIYLNDRMVKRDARRKLRSLKSNVIFDLTGSMLSALLIFNSRAKKIIGINGSSFRRIYDEFVEFRKSPQLIDIYLDAISPVIKLPNRDELKKRPKILSPSGRILIQPFAGWKEKEWNLKKFLSLAEKLKIEYQISIVVPKGQFEFDVLNEIGKSNIDIIQTSSVEELIDLIKDCSLFIGNDSGPLNIANFLGKPTFTIYGSTNPRYTTIESEHQIYVQEIMNCSAKEDDKFCIIELAKYKCSGTQCMNLLTKEDVFRDLVPLLEEYCKKK